MSKVYVVYKNGGCDFYGGWESYEDTEVIGTFTTIHKAKVSIRTDIAEFVDCISESYDWDGFDEYAGGHKGVATVIRRKCTTRHEFEEEYVYSICECELV